MNTNSSIPFLIFLSILFNSCENNSTTPDTNTTTIDSIQQDSIMTTTNLDIQGHRGCRGYWPENSILGFKKAMDMGVHTLEMDVVITKDKHVLVSHEPWFSHEIAATVAPSTSNKKEDRTFLPISKDEEMQHNIYALNLEDIQSKYKCGTISHPRFPDQNKIAVKKPSLAEAVDSIEAYAAQIGLPSVRYNIEIKRNPKGDNLYHPPVEEFTQLVLDVVNTKNIAERTTVQAFDLECLKVAHRLAPNQTLALLIEDWTFSLEKNLDTLGFTPPILSPYYILVNEELMKQAKSHNMKVVPWTANEEEAIQKLLDLGVDGIISDYPDRVVKLSGIRNEQTATPKNK
ncbi:MAG: glycerophosphodiester phosphodiesterase [Aureispira sp.]|nr:glycerophosphodiester phosphodiesterase [Aureispira sp.]